MLTNRRTSRVSKENVNADEEEECMCVCVIYTTKEKKNKRSSLSSFVFNRFNCYTLSA